MNRFIFGYCACSLSALLWPLILPYQWCALWLLIGMMTLYKAPFISGIMMSLMWISMAFYSLYSHSLSNNGTRHIIKAEIVSLVNQNSDWISVDVKNLAQFDTGLLQGYYRLSWPKPPHVEVGQHWQLSIKIKSISNIANQGGFNQQKYFINRHIVYRGSVKHAQLLQPNTSLLNRFKKQLTQGLTSFSNGDILQALLLGQKQQLTTERWQQLRQTGSGHLIAISGLHLSVVFGLFYFLLQGFLKRLQIKRYFVYRAFVLVASLGFAFIYAYLAGFSVATTRAIVMLTMVVSFSLLKQYSTSWDRLLYALFAVLVIDPFAMLSSGFYLSFVALAIILLTLDKRRKTTAQQVDEFGNLVPQTTNLSNAFYQKCCHQLSLLWSIQWRLGLGLSLLQALLFGYISPHSIWLNMLFVPWFSLVVIPVAILSLCVWAVVWVTLYIAKTLAGQSALQYFEYLFLGDKPLLAHWLFTPANITLMPFDVLLDASASLPYSLLTLSEPLIALCLFILLLGGFLWRLIKLIKSGYKVELLRTHQTHIVTSIYGDFIRFNGRVAGKNTHVKILLFGFIVICAMSAIWGGNKLYATFNKAQTNSLWQMHVLDVGQGSAIIIEQDKIAIIYDTGAKYGDDFSYAQRVIIPFLQARGIAHISHIVISHNDNDHAGGLTVLAEHFKTANIVTDIEAVLAAYPNRSQYCSGFKITRQTITVNAIGNGSQFSSDNNQSCVMLVSDNHNKVLLTGDIERVREQQLINDNNIPHVDIMFAPHHGSKTSSSAALLAHLTPKIAIFNAGFANQYGFPKKSVLDRYHQRDIETYVTGEVGQISIDFNRFGYKLRTYRDQLSPFWYNRLFKFGEKVKAE